MLIHLFIYSFIYLFVYLFIYLFICPFIFFVIYLFIYLFVHLFFWSFICLFIYLFVHLFVYLFVYLFIYSFIHQFVKFYFRLWPLMNSRDSRIRSRIFPKPPTGYFFNFTYFISNCVIHISKIFHHFQSIYFLFPSFCWNKCSELEIYFNFLFNYA